MMGGGDDDIISLVDQKPVLADWPTRFYELRGVLDNLVREVKANVGPRNQLGLKVNVALSVAKRILDKYPDDRT